MRAARLRHPLNLRRRQGANPPTWPLVTTVWGAIEPPHLPREGQQTGLLAPWITSIITRYHPDIAAGHLIELSGQWWHIDSVANQNERNQELRVNAREFVGRSALYQPATGSAYPCMAYITHSSDYVGFELPVHERRTTLQLLQPQLVWPWGQPGDVVVVDGVAYTVDAIERGGSMGAVLVVRVRGG